MKKNGNGLVIEKVSRKNFEEFLTLVSKLAEYEKLAPPDTDARERLRVNGLSKSPKYKAYLGKVSGTYVAYVIYLFTYSSFLALPTLFLEDLFVLKEYRRQGIGQKMFDLCRKKAVQKGCGRIEFIVLDWNEPAQRFYEKNKALRMDWGFYRLTKNDF
jgi:ribosomal protein S18 acetylase RimI-like enzyme